MRQRPYEPTEGASPTSSAAFDYATPLRGIDLVYLLGFYFLAGAALTIFVGAGAVIFLHISRVALEQPTGVRATIMIVGQGLLSVATLLFLYLLVKSRDAADFWGALGWHPFPGIPGTRGAAHHDSPVCARRLCIGVDGRMVEPIF